MDLKLLKNKIIFTVLIIIAIIFDGWLIYILYHSLTYPDKYWDWDNIQTNNECSRSPLLLPGPLPLSHKDQVLYFRVLLKAVQRYLSASAS